MTVPQPDEPLAPLSDGELGNLRRVLGVLKNPTSSGEFVSAQGQAIEAFERLLTMAQREAALRTAITNLRDHPDTIAYESEQGWYWKMKIVELLTAALGEQP